tara:strand:- start:646 stop:1740 length:1095 start_codon:yes stop_codon:yes gene_type:complete
MITRINNNRGRRFLDPLEVEAQYHTEDRATNPDLLLWIDFTDKESLRSINSSGVDEPTNGQGIMIAQNKSFYAQGSTAGMTSAGDKALSTGVFQTDASKCPVYTEPAGGGVPYALFDMGDFMQAVSSSGSVSGSNFSTSEIETNKFTAYFVCQRDDPSQPGRQDVFFLTTNSTSSSGTVPTKWMSFYFADPDNSTNYDGTFEMHDISLTAGNRYRYVKYDEADDGNFHYHMFNAYEQYSFSSNHGSLQADGLFHQFTDDYDYNKISAPGFSLLEGTSGTFTSTFEFTGTGTYQPSITIGGQPQFGVVSPKGTFVGKIYEIILFKSEHAGPNVLDVFAFGAQFKRRWSNMLYYFQRKYQYITPKI